MKIIKDRKTMPGPKDWFTGDVEVEMLFGPIEPDGNVGGAIVTFQPGARTAWHTHPIGQTLFITSGKGWVQIEGENKKEVNEGDIVQFEPDVKHWHGATDKTEMSHLAIQESKAGKSVDWFEQVSNKDYLG